MVVVVKILCVLIGYVIGMVILTSHWYSRIKKVDIRSNGSGNPGTTNMGRVLGKKAAIITMIGDITKAFLSAVICWLIFSVGLKVPIDTVNLLLYSGLGVILGHNYPLIFGFKGGKGIATSAGVYLSMVFLPEYFWLLCLLGLITFLAMLFLTNYMSIASLSLVTGFCIEFIIFGAFGGLGISGAALIEADILMIIITVLAFIRHRINIKRLLNGTEAHTFGKG